jgi:hypothetical protein
VKEMAVRISETKLNLERKKRNSKHVKEKTGNVGEGCIMERRR